MTNSKTNTLKEKEENNKGFAFSFGDPEPVLSSSITDITQTFFNESQDYYEPPFSLSGVAKLLSANAHHGAIAYFKRNMLLKHYVDNDILNGDDLGKCAFDFCVFGNFYLQSIKNAFGDVLYFKHIPALNMRRRKTKNKYCLLRKDNEPLNFKTGEIIHYKEYDPMQSIYGIPQYLGGINSVLLNETATLFRRKYFDNGAHMGYIFYTADANLNTDDENDIKEQIRKSKGVGNFRSMYLNLPGGKPDSVKIIPIGDIATKDEFEKIKNITRNDILSMWRIQPALAGVMPENAGGFGDIEKINRVFTENEVKPVQNIILQLNKLLPESKQINFKEPETNNEE
ncbi:MAG: phage portal protein [Cellvibrionaceae bacterium]